MGPVAVRSIMPFASTNRRPWSEIGRAPSSDSPLRYNRIRP
jgi:hypothetical protein